METLRGMTAGFRQPATERRLILSVFLIYSILLGVAISRHEPWFDEAQAWLLARDAPLPDLFLRLLRYEGSPGLWHLLLAIPAKLGMPYGSLNVLSGLLAAAASYLFLRFSPFPLFLRLLFPFTYFSFYQYGVVARSYSLIPLLLFLLAMVFPGRQEKPLPFFTLTVLLANVSLHTVLIALSFVLVHLLALFPNRKEMNRRMKYSNAAGCLLFLLVLCLIRLQLVFPEDLISVAGFSPNLSNLPARSFPALLNSFVSSDLKQPGGSFTAFGIPVLFSVFVIVLSLYWFFLKKMLLLFAIPAATLTVFFTVVYVNAWHTGILFFVWLTVLWISFKNGDEPGRGSPAAARKAKEMVLYVLAAVFIVQFLWTCNAFRYDFTENYSASREISAYLKKENLLDKKIYAVNFHSISILPYFPKNIFCNYNGGKQPSYWIWSHKNAMYSEPYLSTGKYDPDLIVLGVKNSAPSRWSVEYPYVPEIRGFTFRRAFKGALFWKDRLLESDSFLLYERQKP